MTHRTRDAVNRALSALDELEESVREDLCQMRGRRDCKQAQIQIERLHDAVCDATSDIKRYSDLCTT